MVILQEQRGRAGVSLLRTDPSFLCCFHPCQTLSKPCWIVSNRVGPGQTRVGPCHCQARVGPCKTVLDCDKSVLDRVWVRFDPVGVKRLKGCKSFGND